MNHDLYSDTWVATDGLGRELPGYEQCGPRRQNRYVGIFYFICNNYDGPEKPLDVTKILAANPEQPNFVPNRPHYWGEPEFGCYYVVNLQVLDDHTTTVKAHRPGWRWQDVGRACYRVEGNQLMLAVPRALIGMAEGPVAFDFHWANNIQGTGQIEDFFLNGDSAPPRRFDYRYND